MTRARIGLSTFSAMWGLGDGGGVFPAAPPSLSLAELADRAISAGVDVVQFADNRPLSDMVATDRDAVVDRLHSAGIGVEIGTRGLDPRHLADQLAVAVRVGSPILRVVIDEAGAPPLTADAAIDMLRPQRTAFERAGVVLAVENHDHLPAAELARIVTTLGPWTGICLDTVNSFGALEGPQRVVDVLGPHTVNVHVKDFDVVRARHSMGFTIEGRPAGAGRLDLPWLLDELADRLPLSLVLELWTPPQHDLATTRALESTWIDASIPALTELVR